MNEKITKCLINYVISWKSITWFYYDNCVFVYLCYRTFCKQSAKFDILYDEWAERSLVGGYYIQLKIGHISTLTKISFFKCC